MSKTQIKKFTYNASSHRDRKKLAKLLDAGWSITDEAKKFLSTVKVLTLTRTSA